jgi:hypothetical protein
MDSVKHVLAKLSGLRENVHSRLNFVFPDLHYEARMALELFTRYAKLRDELQALAPDLYSDLPVRDIPENPEVTADGKIQGQVAGYYLKTLFDDLNYIFVIQSEVSKNWAGPPSLKVTREGVFFAGQYFDALHRVTDILSKAKRIIVIIDGYVNEDVLNLVSSKDAAVKVEILTKEVSAALSTAVVAFNKQYGRLSVRTSSAFHDRFVIIDDSDFYHFGASIKDLGSRGFMFSMIEESFVIDALRQQFSQEWAKASVVA